jgi:hypothetical protein
MFAKSRAPHKDTGVVLKEAARRLDLPTRRVFLHNAIGLGSLTLLSGCDVTDGISAERMLQSVSDFNDRVQVFLFDPNKLAPEYPESVITRPFPFNAFYSEDKAPVIEIFGSTLRGSLRTKSRGPSKNFMRCRDSPRSQGISASRDGARSANGAASVSRTFWRGSRPIQAPNM